ncbi:PREDICTED: fas-binding factor 1 [Nanorana parkeri]|uniref:fas-binding factor 1 n=1 Tax=Nanorana parkeri TaxID=125878 RepID=UPI000853FD75|nr:PREDICTED: fas-binding factor 1 [Nanorana parkeri]
MPRSQPEVRAPEEASKNKRGLKDSIDDVLGDLLGEDDPSPPKPHKTSPWTSASANKTRSALSASTTKKSTLNDDFFREMAKETAEDSDVSDADPQALLESLKDLDDMDAEILGSRKPKSAPPKGSGMTRSTASNPKAQDKTGTKNANFAPESEKKPQSAPAGPARPYKKFSFDALNDPFEGLLSDEDTGLHKKSKAARAKSESTPVKTEPVSAKTNDPPVISPTRTQARPHPVTRKKDDLNFEEDADDLMDALGFGDGPQSSRTVESSILKPARSKLDELLGRGTSPKLLERPATGDKKEFKLDPKYQNMPENPLSDEDFAFGSYQPTIAMSPEGRPSRRSSVRFSGDGNENLKSEARSLTTTPVARSPAHGAMTGADWLGLKDDDVPDLSPSIPLKEPPQASVATLRSAGRPPPGIKTVGEPTPQPRGTSSETPTVPQEEDEWLLSALARKKAQKQEKVEEQTGQTQNGLKEDSGRGAPVVSVSTAQQYGPSSTVRGDVPATTEVSRSPLPWESPRKVTPSGNSSTNPAIPKQKGNRETVSLAGPSDFRRDQIQLVPAVSKALDKDSQREMLQLQSRILDLEAQIRKLQLQKDQQNMLLETLQQRHKEDLELIENAQRNRLKLVEDSARQREERIQKENQELSLQYLARCQSAESEKAELFAQYQRKLTEFQQEKDKEIERIRELQRLSVQEMCKDHEEQLQRLKRLKEQEIDAVTSASSQTRSLNGVIEQMEAFSHKLSDLSVRVENTQMNTSQEMELGARQREGQLRALQERLTRQQKDMEEERNSLRMIITNMETRLSEQSRLLEQERWRVSAEQAKMDSIQRSLEEQKRIMTQQIAQEREELENAKSALLEEQQSVMTHCAEERRKLAAEWAELHTQQKLSKERVENDITRAKVSESQREGAFLSFAKEQAEVKVQATELRNKEEQMAAAREALEKERHELRLEKDRVYATAMRVRQRAEEVESMSKLALQRHEEGENALAESKKVEFGHQDRLRTIQQQLERLRQQEEHLMEERKNLAHQRRQLNQLRQGLPTMQTEAAQPSSLAEPMHLNGVPFAVPSRKFAISGIHQDKAPQTSDIYAKVALLRLSAQRDRDFLEDEQLFLEALKKSNISCSQTV